MHPRVVIAAAAVLAVWAGAFALPAAAQSADEDFLSVDQAFSVETEGTDDGRLTVTWRVAPDYYLYRHQFDVQGDPAPVADVDIPAGEPISDEFFGESEVYHDDVSIVVDPGEARRLELTWQGCAEAGLCYPPQHTTLNLADYDLGGGAAAPGGSDDEGSRAPTTPAGAGDAVALGEDQSLAAQLSDSNTAWVLLVFFGLGLLLVFTPCVLPMVPILTSLIVGSGARGRRGLTLSLAYVLPMAVTYALLGVAAALAGANLQAALQTPWVLGAFALVFVALALAMFGVYELQLPAALRDRLDRASSAQRGGSLGGAAVMGALSALIVGPCMTAPLAGALLFIAESGNVLIGGSALFALGLGMGAPLVLAGSLGARFLPRPGPWMNGVKAVFGFVLLGMALWLVARVTPDPWMLGLWGAWLLAIGTTLYQVALRAARTTLPSAMIARVAGLLIALWGALLVIGAAGGASDPTRPLAFAGAPGNTTGAGGEAGAQTHDFMARFDPVADLDALDAQVAEAGANGRWTLVDFYADWCISCKVIESEVFGDARVQAALADVQLLRPDVTDNDAADRALMGHYSVVGPPTLLLIGPNGEEARSARIVGELDAEAFLDHLERARADAENF
ncbi:protein-disulfide reductase DsbD [Salinisphaera orenii]|uniref:protein-disulfide reductase DsbD n=1 Tax=Salinisphaera orenii TaxID=856731 RepID=UPI000F47B998|nr:protein-disulfide reductase DsbD [Salinisphaera halophila]